MALSRTDMDRKIDEHFGFEASDNVEGVLATPTYFVDGTEITWLEDKVMEDFLRTKFPRIKTITYEK